MTSSSDAFKWIVWWSQQREDKTEYWFSDSRRRLWREVLAAERAGKPVHLVREIAACGRSEIARTLWQDGTDVSDCTHLLLSEHYLSRRDEFGELADFLALQVRKRGFARDFMARRNQTTLFQDADGRWSPTISDNVGLIRARLEREDDEACAAPLERVATAVARQFPADRAIWIGQPPLSSSEFDPGLRHHAEEIESDHRLMIYEERALRFDRQTGQWADRTERLAMKHERFGVGWQIESRADAAIRAAQATIRAAQAEEALVEMAAREIREHGKPWRVYMAMRPRDDADADCGGFVLHLWIYYSREADENLP